jgi:hypothetical protein
MDTLTCPHCGMRNDPGDRVCVHCAKPTDVGAGVVPVVEERQWEPALTAPPPPPPVASPVSHHPQETFPVTSQPSNGPATAGMVFGILGVVLMWVPVVGFVLAILAVVFGVLGLGRANTGGGNKGQAIAGLILGAAGIILPILLLGAVLNIATDSVSQISDIQSSLGP